ncbi:response regulator receiver protein [Halomicrobium mukohataei DSM 12286]|uniref:Response regulator receiver protein n=1 Tax=Halomicrobium mukohataei (strain ATCC 700874 / DSM 12286 / JCM 9738 / NCIMB 13541) TaxID=485914 RepID=C7P4B2_HALMD|nr:response regulator receiver protein [Halomicrobium mukohataei DSM 12286]
MTSGRCIDSSYRSNKYRLLGTKVALVRGVSDDVAVLVLEDETELLDAYVNGLEDEYDVYAAETAATATDHVDGLGDDLDVALLDRRLPERSGDDVLKYIQSAPIDCRTAMVTAVDPSLDIIDMGFDDYVVKPVTPSDLRTVIDRLLKLEAYDDVYQTLSEKRVKRSVLAAELSRTELERSEEFAALQSEIADLEAQLESIESEIDDEALPH